MMYPKPKLKHKKILRNKPPTINDICRYCHTPYAQTHEVFEGTGRKQLSMKYHMQVKLCNTCHSDIQTHPLQGKDMELKQEFQTIFEKEHGHEFYMKCFMFNYLEG